MLVRTRSSGQGSTPREVEVGGGADANVFNERGLHCVNVANGMTKIHTADEEIAVADLEAMVGVTLELVAAGPRVPYERVPVTLRRGTVTRSRSGTRASCGSRWTGVRASRIRG